MYQLAIAPFTYPVTRKQADATLFKEHGRAKSKGPLSADDMALVSLVTPETQPEPTPPEGQRTVRDTTPAVNDGVWSYGWTLADIPPPTIADVITERELRLAAGFDYDFADARGVHRVGTTDADMTGWDEVSKAASALVALGLPDQAISIVTDTGPCDVTAIEWQSVLVGAMQFRQPIFAASFVLQYSDPIPQDYADDSYW
jgi:hypothetical protein